MKKYVTNLTLSRELKRLDVPQDTYFYWCDFGSSKNKKIKLGDPADAMNYTEICSAFTVGELLKLIGDRFLGLQITCPSTKIWSADTKTHGCHCKRCEEENIIKTRVGSVNQSRDGQITIKRPLEDDSHGECPNCEFNKFYRIKRGLTYETTNSTL